VRRQQVAYAQGRGLSRRRACALLSVARSTVGYVSRLIARDAPVLPAMRTLAAQYPRYGYRTIRIFLDRQGHVMSADRMYRLWRQEALQVPKQRPRRRVATGRPRPLPPTAVNHVWAYDFVFDTCADGRTLKCLTVIDEFTRECLAIDVAGGIRSGRVAQFYYDVPAGPFYGYNRAGAKPSQGVIWNWWRQGMMGGAKAHYDGIVAFSQTDFTEDLKKITVPVLVMHGDDDQIVPYADSAPLSAQLLRNSTLKTYKGFPHGMPTTEAETINADLLTFVKA